MIFVIDLIKGLLANRVRVFLFVVFNTKDFYSKSEYLVITFMIIINQSIVIFSFEHFLAT